MLWQSVQLELVEPWPAPSVHFLLVQLGQGLPVHLHRVQLGLASGQLVPQNQSGLASWRLNMCLEMVKLNQGSIYWKENFGFFRMWHLFNDSREPGQHKLGGRAPEKWNQDFQQFYHRCHQETKLLICLHKKLYHLFTSCGFCASSWPSTWIATWRYHLRVTTKYHL